MGGSRLPKHRTLRRSQAWWSLHIVAACHHVPGGEGGGTHPHVLLDIGSPAGTGSAAAAAGRGCPEAPHCMARPGGGRQGGGDTGAQQRWGRGALGWLGALNQARCEAITCHALMNDEALLPTPGRERTAVQAAAASTAWLASGPAMLNQTNRRVEPHATAAHTCHNSQWGPTGSPGSSPLSPHRYAP